MWTRPCVKDCVHEDVRLGLGSVQALRDGRGPVGLVRTSTPVMECFLGLAADIVLVSLRRINRSFLGADQI